MAGEDVEVGIESFQVEVYVRHSLGAVYKNLCAHPMGGPDQFRHLVHRPQHIGDMGDS